MEIIEATTAGLVARKLLEIKAIKLQPQQPFTWASGWKSPIYCDNRLALSYPEVRTLIKGQLVEVAKEKFHGVEAIAGVATAGIPQGALLADALDLPFLYVRSKAKGHGMENMIEGKVTPGQKVLVVEDLVSTGGSSLKAVQDLRNAGF
ncbi:MAG TPA: orotate phosphoribosyltransferase, partial [Cyclobacteriaceae bacterium]|nr:orotate phosphoribosyltransferase [Cyclobacteriaceae bacterium]